ncbi:hypothetical protein I302_104134 [Kwoniella bestiolae CBS 10118]|uniref:Kinase n=1 Tax=Kwoniella bestiolae CBS 10118 TaxID=1296100 RepID=A0A1B9GAE1_9TREE|nr:hypothetical protein I302_02842 [Kwoniella bestiolae CBS 10118]OCF27992.1 hypothetical protein I302_02842 [Kwoniella bestiolae CBS 10118]
MPTSVHSMGDLEDADNAFRESVGLGTRREREDFITVHDPDGGIMNIPQDEYYAMYPDQDDTATKKANDNGSSMKLTQENLSTITRSYSLPSFGSSHPFDPAPQVPGMMSDDQSVPDVDNMSVPDLASDAGSMLETPYQDTEDPMNMQLPIRVLSPSEPSDTESEVESGGEMSRDSLYNENAYEVVDFKITEGPPPWRLRDLETGGGHGMSISPDGTTVVKRTPEEEIAFYERIKCNDALFRAIQSWVPEYRGCFIDNPLMTTGNFSQGSGSYRLSSGQISDSSLRPPLRPSFKRSNTADTHSTSIMLENLRYGFDPRTISEFDVKLGRNMIDPWAKDTDQAKIEKMTQQVRDSTSFLDAVRLIWANTSIQDPVTGSTRHVKTDKHYGKSLRRSANDHERANCETLSDAMVRLFPSPRDFIVPKGDSDWTNSGSEQSGEPLSFSSDLQRYRYEERENLCTNLRRSKISLLLPSTNQIRDGPRPCLRPRVDLFDLQRMNRERDQVNESIETMRHIRHQIKSLKEAVSKTPWSFAGSSLYVVHGEEDSGSRFGLARGPMDKVGEEMNESQAESCLKFIGNYNHDPVTDRYRINKEEDIDIKSHDLPDTSRFNYFSPFHQPNRESVVKLIDFARTDIAEEPDRDVMDGLQTIVDLMSSRISTLKDMKKDMQDQITRTRDEIMSSR